MWSKILVSNVILLFCFCGFSNGFRSASPSVRNTRDQSLSPFQFLLLNLSNIPCEANWSFADEIYLGDRQHSSNTSTFRRMSQEICEGETSVYMMMLLAWKISMHDKLRACQRALKLTYSITKFTCSESCVLSITVAQLFFQCLVSFFPINIANFTIDIPTTS